MDVPPVPGQNIAGDDGGFIVSSHPNRQNIHADVSSPGVFPCFPPSKKASTVSSSLPIACSSQGPVKLGLRDSPAPSKWRLSSWAKEQDFEAIHGGKDESQRSISPKSPSPDYHHKWVGFQPSKMGPLWHCYTQSRTDPELIRIQRRILVVLQCSQKT